MPSINKVEKVTNTAHNLCLLEILKFSTAKA